jgi:hypothetical protein
MMTPYVVEALPPQGAQAGCDGLQVTRIDVHTYRPSSIGAADRTDSTASERTVLPHTPTQAWVVRAYVLLKVGESCTEKARLESERMLRAQEFVASARVRALPDGPGLVRITIDVVDEIAWVTAARFSGITPTALTLGSINARGRGLTLVGGIERGGPYRPGGALTIGQFGILDRPAFAELELHRRPLGGLLRASLSEPFLTDGQRVALQASFAQEVDYGRLARIGLPDVTSRVRRTAYSVGYLRRVGTYRGSRIIGLGGILLMGTDIRSEERIMQPTDSGLVALDDSVLVGRFPNYAVGRVALTGGIRALRFLTVRRFESLRAEQDVGQGMDLQLLAGPSLGVAGSSRDVLLAANLYIGMGGERSFLALRARAEGRQTSGNMGWNGVVGSARLRWYRLPSATRTQTVTASVARIDQLVFPVQLTFRDEQGGLIGFPGAQEAGGRRAVLRIEERRLLPWMRTRAAMAVGGFVDAGRLWAGDAVYGRTTPVRGSLGLSLFAAYPAAGKRFYRVDFAVPVNPEQRGQRFAIRVSSGDRTGTFWQEPADVDRARTGTGPPALTRW